MKALLSIILFAGYWFVIALFIIVFAGYIIDDETATNLGMLLAIPLSFIATKKTINKIFKNNKQPEENQEQEKIEEKPEEKEQKEPEYSYVKPKEEDKKLKGKKPSERYLEKVKQEEELQKQKLEKEEIKERVIENIQKFREETYGEDIYGKTKIEKEGKELSSFELMPGLEVKITANIDDEWLENNKRKAEEVKVDIVLPYIIEAPIRNKVEPVVKLIHENDIPHSKEDLIKMLIDEGYLFNEDKWELTKDERSHVIKRLFQIPLPQDYEIQNLIDRIRMKKRSIFISEDFLKTIPRYQIGLFIKQTTEQFFKEGRTEEEFLEVINQHIPKEILEDDVYVSKYLKEMIKVISPTKRQRIKGLDRVEHYWNHFVNDLQLWEIHLELSLIDTNYYMIKHFKHWRNSNIIGFRLDVRNIPLFFNIGLGENIVPPYIF